MNKETVNTLNDCKARIRKAALWQQQKQHQRALQLLQASQHCQRLPDYWFLLSETLISNRAPLEARNAARRGLKLDAENLNGKLVLAECELKLEHEPAAVKLLQDVLRRQPDNWHAHHLLLTALSRMGRMEDAQALIRQGLERFPGDPGLIFQATVLKMYDLPELNIDQVKQWLEQAKKTEDRFTLLFVLSRLYEREQDFAQAAEALKQANRIKRQSIQRKPPRLVDSTVEVIRDFTPERFTTIRDLGHPSDRPIFIVGMPRSGTTLTEQILNRHPQVTGVGERQVMGSIIGQAIRALPAGGSVMEKLAQQKKLWRRMGEQYLQWMDKWAGPRGRTADKMPLNANMVGFIRLIFPNAHIVHCRRDPYDTLLSCLQAHFKEEKLTFSPEEWGQVYASYEALMQHWDRLFPGEIIHLDYESLVRDPQQQIRNLLQALELPFHGDCLHPERTDATIRTASITQVRSPINAGSVGRSRAWMPWLDEVKQSLEQARQTIAQATSDAKLKQTQ